VHDHLNHSQAGAKIQQDYPVKVTPSTSGLLWTYSLGSEIDQKTTHPERRHLH
jgi:hypothetical protein